MKRLLRIIVFLWVAVVLMTSAGCAYGGYRGDYAGAYTLMCSQVPDMLGARSVGFSLLDPQILVLERDDFGRTLYMYLEDTDGFLSIGIVQKEEEGKVFFYPEWSTLSFVMPDRYYDISNFAISENTLLSLIGELCPANEMDAFKEANDWGLPLNESKLDSAEITLPKIAVRWEHRKDSVNLSQQKWEKQIVSVAHKNGHVFDADEAFYFEHATYMATDDYGRRLYYVEGYYYIYPENDPHIWYVKHLLEMIAIINPDGTFDSEIFMVELTDKANYQEQIRDLKIDNGWDQPLN